MKKTVVGGSRQPDRVIGNVQAREGCNENRREGMDFAKCHVTANSEVSAA